MEKRGDINPAYTPIVDEHKKTAKYAAEKPPRNADNLDNDFRMRAAKTAKTNLKERKSCP